MKESDLKTVFVMLGVDWLDFENWIVGKTISHHQGEPYYWQHDIDRFIREKLYITKK